MSNFTISHINCRSLTSEFNLFCESFERSNHDIIAVSETWLNENVLNDAISIPQYNFLRRDRPTRGPICDILLCMGDFNINLLNFGNSETDSLIELVEIYGLHQLVSEPTRVTATSASLLDLILTNDKEVVVKLSWTYAWGWFMTFRAFTRFKRTRNPTHFSYYKTLRNMTTSAIRQEKRAYLDHRARSGNIKTFWSDLKALNVFSGSCRDMSLPDHLSNADGINHFFTSSSATSSPHPHLLNYYANPDSNSLAASNDKFVFQSVTDNDVYRIIKKMSSKSIGCDGIGIEHRLITNYC
ncbi:hypothetical protein QE152_g16982 [Popillia japonica]|uniref:Endonuclease/exonuclease/phosphatase domain-containing protein n=1 Tax=Popillia japonica TaxID=7064 RepID=A0AAW1L5L4_POPJA